MPGGSGGRTASRSWDFLRISRGIKHQSDTLFLFGVEVSTHNLQLQGGNKWCMEHAITGNSPVSYPSRQVEQLSSSSDANDRPVENN